MKQQFPIPTFETKVWMAFSNALRNFWRTEAYLATVFEASELATKCIADGLHPSIGVLELGMRESQSYQLYGWLERRSQQFKYLSRWGVVNATHSVSDQIKKELDASARVNSKRLNLDSSFDVPDYVRDSDTHQHPGATWSTDQGAVAYEWSTGVSSFALGNPDRLLTWYADMVAKKFTPRRVLDIGCGAGKSSRAIKRSCPNADVHGVDVAAPMLRLAHYRSQEESLDITWWQRKAENLGFEESSFDLVTSHWLFHEMPPTAIRQALREMHRVLDKGGTIAIYDIYLEHGGDVAAWLRAGYSARNNEPFSLALYKLDIEKELKAAGFRDVMVGFSELNAKHDGHTMAPSRMHPMSVITAQKP